MLRAGWELCFGVAGVSQNRNRCPRMVDNGWFLLVCLQLPGQKGVYHLEKPSVS